MAKKTKNTYVQNSEPVANSDRVQGLVAKCDNLQFEVQNQHLKNVDIKSMIRNIRGQQVMLDYDLAKLYGVTTGRLNEQVKRNVERFPDDFMFQLTKGELELLKSQIVISKSAENQHDNVLISQFATSKLIERRGGRQKPVGPMMRKLRTQARAVTDILNGKIPTDMSKDMLAALFPRLNSDAETPAQPYLSPAKVGRNDPCPCGSGRKYKHCCGKA